MKTVLSIAGSDPSGGAGIQADLQNFQVLGVRGVTAITALTVQNDRRFYALNPVPSTLLRDQLRSITDRYKIDAIRIGMLGTADNTLATCHFLNTVKVSRVVLDPALISSTGAPLLDPRGVAILKQSLIPLATVVTPNLDEAETLTKMRVRSVDEMQEAALHIFTAYPGVKAVLIKGGHLKDDATDVLYDGKDFQRFVSRKRFPRSIHGTGCALSAALAAYLARGYSLEKSVRQAKEFTTDWIRARS